MLVRTKSTTRLKHLDLDKEKEKDLKSGKGFIIKEKATAKDGMKKNNSIYSRKYGTVWGDSDPFMERYRCECGNKNMMGKFNEGEVCPKCGHEVKFVDRDLEITGWVELKGYYVMSPVFYLYTASLIQPDRFKRIIKFNRKINTEGDYDSLDIDYSKKEPFKGIGMVKFKEHFEEIIDYYNTKKSKQKYYDALMEHKDKVFTKSIPVYSLLLRPAKVDDSSNFYYSKINPIYTTIVNLSIKVNQENKETIVKIYPSLYKIQEKFMDVYEHILDEISGKTGKIRGKTLGCRFNFTGRAVIRPGKSDLNIDEVEVSYLTFLELYKLEIINLLTRFNGISIKEAEYILFKASIKFNDEVYNIMKFIINKEGGEYMKINRNPSLHYNSLLIMRIKRITKDLKNKSMGVPIQILRIIAGDFDGDVLNQGSIKDKRVLDAFKNSFNPRENIVIDRNTGLFNYDVGLARDQMIALSYLNMI